MKNESKWISQLSDIKFDKVCATTSTLSPNLIMMQTKLKKKIAGGGCRAVNSLYNGASIVSIGLMN